MADIRGCISHVNKHALIKETTYAAADLEFLFDKHEASVNYSAQARTNAVPDNHTLSHKITDQISSTYVRLEEGTALDRNKLEEYIGHLAWEAPEATGIQLMRYKGIFIDSNSRMAYGLQGVEDLFEFRKDPNAKVEAATFLFVVRGKLDGDKVRQEILDKCSILQ